MNAHAKLVLLFSALLSSACTACAPPSVESLAPSTGLEVDAVAGATHSEYDVYAGEVRVAELLPANEVVALATGHYSITRHSEAAAIWSSDVEIADGRVTHLAMGAIRVQVVPGAVDGLFSTWSADGRKLIDRDEPDAIVTAPAGSFRITSMLEPEFVWAQGLVVIPGQIAELRLGGVRVRVPAGSTDEAFTIYDVAKTHSLIDYEPVNVIVSVPAGSMTVTRHLEREMEFGTPEITAGQVTEVELGAIRWNGAVAVDVWNAAATKLLATGLLPGDQFAARASDYALLDQQTALAHATVTTGAVTDAH